MRLTSRAFELDSGHYDHRRGPLPPVQDRHDGNEVVPVDGIPEGRPQHPDDEQRREFFPSVRSSRAFFHGDDVRSDDSCFGKSSATDEAWASSLDAWRFRTVRGGDPGGEGPERRRCFNGEGHRPVDGFGRHDEAVRISTKDLLTKGLVEN